MTIGDRIKKQRELLGISQVELAEINMKTTLLLIFQVIK